MCIMLGSGDKVVNKINIISASMELIVLQGSKTSNKI